MRRARKITIKKVAIRKRVRRVGGTGYDLGPDGLTFDLPADLSIRYEADSLPSGVDPSSLVLLSGSSADGPFQQLPSSADASAAEITATAGGVSGSVTVTVSGSGPITWTLDQRETTQDLVRVWGSAPDDIVAVGNGGTVLRYDGSSWSDWSGIIPETLDLRAVGGRPGSGQFFIGGGGSTQEPVMYKRTLGGSTGWEAVAVPLVASGSSLAVRGIFMQAGTYGSTTDANAFAVGNADNLVARIWQIGADGDFKELLGAGSPGENTGLFGVWSSADGEVAYAVGVNGVLLKNVAGTGGWTQVDAGQPSSLSCSTTACAAALKGVWGSSASDVYVVGESGTLLHFDGTTWQREDPGRSVILNRVFGTGPNDVFVTGRGGTLLHNDGSGWKAVATGTTENLGGIWVSAHRIVVVGKAGTILMGQR